MKDLITLPVKLIQSRYHTQFYMIVKATSNLTNRHNETDFNNPDNLSQQIIKTKIQ